MLICPVCGEKLNREDRTVFCEKGHKFDLAKEGYVNLLRSSKSGDKIGDDKLAARCRRDFLNLPSPAQTVRKRFTMASSATRWKSNL